MNKTHLRDLENRKIIVDVSGSPTISAYLRKLYPNHTWSQVRTLLANGHIRLNEELIREESIRLKKNDVIEIKKQGEGKEKKFELSYDMNLIQVLYLDEQVLVVEKPYGMITQIIPAELPIRTVIPTGETLEELVIPLVKQMERSNQKSGKPRLVHRLDMDTSGVMVFARTQKSYNSLKDQFFYHSVKREYHAFVFGVLKNPITKDTFLVRNRGDGLRGSVTHYTKGSKRAITEIVPLNQIAVPTRETMNVNLWKVLETKMRSGENSNISHDQSQIVKQKFGYDCTFIRCTIKTGRQHQIRIHSSELDHPVLGDPIYGNQLDWELNPPNRMMLHAFCLGFEHPSKGYLEFHTS